MNITGLDYNSQRERLVLPEYGREIQNMVDHCVTLPTKRQRQQCARTIVAVMERMVPQNRHAANYKQKLWDHLALMSNFNLDIDWPYDISNARQMQTPPKPLDYPKTQIHVRHYGKYLFEIFEQLKTMAPGRQRDDLVRYTANQMKRDLVMWSHGYTDDEKVADDLARYTDGHIQLDLSRFRFAKVDMREPETNGKRRKRR